jgi:hypothetical protein
MFPLTGYVGAQPRQHKTKGQPRQHKTKGHSLASTKQKATAFPAAILATNSSHFGHQQQPFWPPTSSHFWPPQFPNRIFTRFLISVGALEAVGVWAPTVFSTSFCWSQPWSRKHGPEVWSRKHGPEMVQKYGPESMVQKYGPE